MHPFTSILAIIALASSATATIRGGQCCSSLLDKCHYEGAWGCVQVDAAYCVDQTKNCDYDCGGSGYAYQKRKYAAHVKDR